MDNQSFECQQAVGRDLPVGDQAGVVAAWHFCRAVIDQRRKRARAGATGTGVAAALPAPGWWPEEGRALLDLYAPLVSLKPGQRFVIGHLAQGIDGTIATAHLVDPQLTVRLVEGENPARVVLDPSVHLKPRLSLFQDDAADSLIVAPVTMPAQPSPVGVLLG